MSKPSDITTALITLLKNSSYLTYVGQSQFLVGVRESITQFPCIILEPVSGLEKEHVYPVERITRRYAIMGYILVTNKDLQIVGNSAIKGIDDMENDIKLALDSDRTLGGKAIFVHIVDSKCDFVSYPVRDITITIDVDFQQTRGTRT